MAMAQQRAQQNVSASTASSVGMTDGNARAQGHGGGSLPSNSQIHQSTQSSGIGSQEGGNSQGQEPERPTASESNVTTANDQTLQQSSSTISEGVQNAMRRNGALSLVASAASAFDAAKDIMEALRSKHANLASELEVIMSALLSCTRQANEFWSAKLYFTFYSYEEIFLDCH